MTDKPRTALLAGASGLVGSELLQGLLQSPIYDKVKVFVRTPLQVEHAKLEQVIVNYDQLENYEQHVQVDDVYCCLGTTIKKAGSQAAFRKVDYEYPVRLAQLAKRCGVQQYLIITAIGADANSSIFYSRVKGEVEAKLKGLGIASLQIFRPSLLLGKRTEFRLGERLASWLSPLYGLLLFGSLRKYRSIQASTVAKGMLAAGAAQLPGIHIYNSAEIERLSQRVQV